MKSISMPRDHGENLPIDRFRFRQPAGLVVPEREFERLLGRHGGHRGML